MRYLGLLAGIGLLLAVAATAGATTTTYGGNVTPLWNLGVGQPTGNFVVDDSGTVQTALRATGRYTGPLAPVTGEGRYFAFAGTSTDGSGGPPLPGVTTWNFHFHANVDTGVAAWADPVTGSIVPVVPPSMTLDDVTVLLTVDADPAADVTTGLVLDLKQLAEYSSGGAIDWTPYIGLRGSENLGFSWLATAAAAQSKTWNFDPNALGEYEFSLAVLDKTTSSLLCQTDMDVSVVPEPVTMAGLMLGIGCLSRYVRRRKV